MPALKITAIAAALATGLLNIAVHFRAARTRNDIMERVMRTRLLTCIVAFLVAAPAIVAASGPASARSWHRGFGHKGDIAVATNRWWYRYHRRASYSPDLAYGYPGYYPYGPRYEWAPVYLPYGASYVRAPAYAYAPDYQRGDYAIEPGYRAPN